MILKFKIRDLKLFFKFIIVLIKGYRNKVIAVNLNDYFVISGIDLDTMDRNATPYFRLRAGKNMSGNTNALLTIATRDDQFNWNDIRIWFDTDTAKDLQKAVNFNPNLKKVK
tara:strand:+ start:291 stop:626 length:336 start_codon:yes stop_codon:yes gene_type:complete